MSYTKGKWEIDGTTVYALNKRGENIFYAGIQHGQDDNGKSTSIVELVSDARLISASPDMYEALKFLLNPSFGNDAWLLAKFPEAYSLCSKAIAKAEAK